MRIDVRAALDGARLGLQVDIGFGDAVTPAAQPVTYPILLANVPAPTLPAHPKAKVVAEKLHAVTVLGMTNTRMEGFLDLFAARPHDGRCGTAARHRGDLYTLANRDARHPTDCLRRRHSSLFAGPHQQNWRRRQAKNLLGVAAHEDASDAAASVGT